MSHAIQNAYSIGGMNSDTCVTAVRKKLFDVYGVSSVKIDFENKLANISSFEKINIDKLEDALSHTNYTIAEL